MFISHRKLKLPSSMNTDHNQVSIVDSFRLLSVELDNTLKFHKHVIKNIKTFNTVRPP